MLTRLQVSGFKNLVDVDVRFGPFTCIAGPNAVGKSNLFDAILFLRDLADKPFVEAAGGVRGGEEDVSRLFTAGRDRMSFVAEMLIPSHGVDEFGQQATAASTFVEYRLELGLRSRPDGLEAEIELLEEGLSYILKREAKARLGFPYKREWLDSVFKQHRYGKAFISTDHESRKVMRHQDQQVAQERKKSSAGRPLEYALTSLPRTVLSSARNAQESRTAVLVRREMQAWHLLQLEPAAMRLPDSFGAPDHIAPNGAHLAATLYRVARAASKMSTASEDMAADNPVLVRLANRLSELVSSVRSVRVTRDEQRRLYRLLMAEADGSEWPAASLSDGTVRFLALAVLEEDPKETGVICMEEPENGVHPARVGAMLSLLQDIAVDATCAVGDDNPLRQVIVNTHSPIVAMEVDHRDLILAQPLERRVLRSGPVIPASPLPATVLFRAVGGSWRTQVEHALGAIAFGDILAYLNPSISGSDEEGSVGTAGRHSVREYVNDRQLELRLMALERDSE